jgi:hypothetical protein
MRIRVDTVDRRLLPALAAPPVGVADEEELVLSEVFEAGQVLVRGFCSALLPRCKCGGYASGISDVLAKSQLAVDVQWLVIWSWDGVLGVLVYETFCAFFEAFNSAVGPPVGVVPVLIIVTAGRIEGM